MFVYFFIEARWNVAVAEGQLTFPFRTSELRWLPADSSAFIADPIAVSVDGCRAVFCELFPYKSRKGSIAVISVDDETRKPTTVIEQPRHLSYPFIVQDGTETYCIPEDSQSRRVTLYRAKRFPFEWEEAGVLLEDVPAVDPTIFYDGERWWLFATRADREPNLNLFAWHAPTLQGPWSAHLANPIKTDISGARPAGKLFRIAGDVYRPAQDCARSYGHAVTVHRIVELSPSSFFEERVARLTPIAPYSNGIHTLSSAQDFFAVDGRRDYIDLRKPWRVWRERRLRRP
ncbi:MAG: hypothetical protein JOY59_09295 [Candidatus Eremiobacteraeota bacterium]|nr:hypothetical protein [Candidatus Eremiobacteraeota bacterium]